MVSPCIYTTVYLLKYALFWWVFCITIYIYRYGEMKCFNTYKKYFFNGCKN